MSDLAKYSMTQSISATAELIVPCRSTRNGRTNEWTSTAGR